MPTAVKVTGRSSSITNSFVNSIIPVVVPTTDDVARALDVLGMTPEALACAYCGDPMTEWDHLRPLVVGKKPTGYISGIANLVPACGNATSPRETSRGTGGLRRQRSEHRGREGSETWTNGSSVSVRTRRGANPPRSTSTRLSNPSCGRGIGPTVTLSTNSCAHLRRPLSSCAWRSQRRFDASAPRYDRRRRPLVPSGLSSL